MTKIRDIIQINSGYASYVDLHEEYKDFEKNRGRMIRYKPITAHRIAFEKIAQSLNPLDRRCYFLSGSYGTGKSHLLLMLANYFANPSDVPEVEAFFENYKAAQSEVLLKTSEEFKERTASSLKDARKTGRFVVAICRHSLLLNFESTLLRALEEALQKDDVPILVNSHYQEALRKIQEWKENEGEGHHYADFQASINLLFPNWTVKQVITGLQQYEKESFDKFTVCFRRVTTLDFTYSANNLRDIIKDIISSKEFKERYKGIVFLYDEFGSSIDDGLVNYSSLLDFAQFCAASSLDSNGGVIFVGTGHRAFRNHGKVGDLDSQTLEARFTEIGLQTQGMEDIIAAVVQPKRDAPEWKELMQTYADTSTWFSTQCNHLRLFSWLPAPKVKNQIIQGIYPMHPLATYALLKLAGEVASDNRSVIKFFAPEFDTGASGWSAALPYSYPWFIENHHIQEQDQTVLYTADLLIEFFKDSLVTSNTRLTDRVRSAVQNYETTLRELREYQNRKSESQLFPEADELMLQILKAILLIDLINTPEISISATEENILFALGRVSDGQKAQVVERLKLLSQAGVLFYNQGVYEMVRSDRIDIRRLIDHYKSSPDNRPTRVLDHFRRLVSHSASDDFLEAKKYNDPYNEDKRLKVLFVTPTALSEPRIIEGKTVSFFDGLEYDRRQITDRTKGYEGVAVYVYCETEQEINSAILAAGKNNQSRVVIGIPRSPISVFDPVFTLSALNSEAFKLQAQNFGAFERAEERRTREEASKSLADAWNSYSDNRLVAWFGVHGSEIIVDSADRFDIANQMIQKLFGGRRTTFAHLDLNKSHMNLSGSERAKFKEAADILFDLSQPLRINWTWPDNRGTTKYIRKCFIEHQILKVSFSDGDFRNLEIERDFHQFETALPAYAWLLRQLEALSGKPPINLQQFLLPIFDEYGQGDYAVTLMLLLARRFFGDSLRFKQDPSALIDIQFESYEDVLSLVQGQSPSAVVIFEPVSPEDIAYFAKVTQILTNQPISAGKTYSITEAYQAAVNWWEKLPKIARTLDIYTPENRPLADAFSQLRSKDPFRFIKYDLPVLLGLKPNEVITSQKVINIEVSLKAFKTFADAIESIMQAKVLKQIAEVFSANSALDLDIQQAMKEWFYSLSEIQKDPLSSYHTGDSRQLVRQTAFADIRELLFVTLPTAFSLGSVGSWMSDYLDIYIQRIKAAKKHIEDNRIDVGKLVVDYGQPVEQKGQQVTYRGELELHADTENGSGEIFYTDDGSDPSTSPHRKSLKPGDTLVIRGNRKVKLVIADGKGNYGSVTTIDAIDALQKHKITRPEQRVVDDEAITFIFPKTSEALKITVSSLFDELIESGLFSAEELHAIISDLLDRSKK